MFSIYLYLSSSLGKPAVPRAFRSNEYSREELREKFLEKNGWIYPDDEEVINARLLEKDCIIPIKWESVLYEDGNRKKIIRLPAGSKLVIHPDCSYEIKTRFSIRWIIEAIYWDMV